MKVFLDKKVPFYDFKNMDFHEVCKILSLCDYNSIGMLVSASFLHEDNTYHELGKSLISVFLDCHSEDEFLFKNEVLTALTGYDLKDFLLQF